MYWKLYVSNYQHKESCLQKCFNITFQKRRGYFYLEIVSFYPINKMRCDITQDNLLILNLKNFIIQYLYSINMKCSRIQLRYFCVHSESLSKLCKLTLLRGNEAMQALYNFVDSGSNYWLWLQSLKYTSLMLLLVIKRYF